MSSNNWQYKMQEFMRGRNGSDDLGRFALGVAMVLLVVSFIVGIFSAGVASVFSLLALACIVYSFWRMMSKNVAKRQEENRRWGVKYIPVQVKFRRRCSTFKEWRKYHKDYHLYTCKTCGQSLRVPKGKGKVKVTCPKCHTSFIAKS